MNNYQYDDPIEDYDAGANYDYPNKYNAHSYHQTSCYIGGNQYYDDDPELDYELSSPSPIRSFKQPYNLPQIEYSTTNHDDFEHNGSMTNSYGACGNFEQPNSNSQPQSWSSRFSHDSRPLSTTKEISQSTPRNTHGIRLRPISELPDKFRTLFKFGVFNAVQSTCVDEVLYDDKNLVISAPTGSGKTVLFELAMIRTLEKSQRMNKPVKCIYIAPTKKSFKIGSTNLNLSASNASHLSIRVDHEVNIIVGCELTGDTVVFGNSAWGDAKHASIIVTTCEKWDSLTRNWYEHERILSQIELFLVDEVHILNESRGSVLEVVTSRMKLRGANVRFVLVSATVPNIDDVARWIGSGFGKFDPAKVFEFGDDYRPCKLTRHVVGVPKKNGSNDFQFNKVLDLKLYATIKEFSVGKPTLVFVSTRKGVFGTAEQLMKEYLENEGKKAALPWLRPPRVDTSFSDKRLNAAIGIGVHHAGLNFDDRRATEQLFLSKVIRTLVATSTLAVGVNLPAHMVVIKGVQTFANNASREYSDLDIMQMLGRAGRPQFGKSTWENKDGIAVILCEAHLESKYKALVQGKTVLESSLHLNLAEHINSEIGLGTITDVNSAQDWLQSSFLYQRMQKNPQYYAITKSDGELITQGDASLVLHSIEQLKTNQLIDHDEMGKSAGKLSSTQYGDIMSKYYIRRATMELLLALPAHASLKEIKQSVRQKSSKILYNKLRKDTEIRFELKKVDKTCDKIFLLVQAVLGGISFNNPDYKSSDSQPNMEAFTVFKHISRIAKAALDVAVVRKDGAQVKHGLELFRCLSAKAWEDRAIVLRQIEHLGEKSIKVLAEHGVTTFAQLKKQNPLRIETLLNRRSPFGLEVISSVNELPEYMLQIQELELHSNQGRTPVEVKLGVECTLLERDTSKSKSKKSRTRSYDRTAVLTLTSDMDFVDFRRVPSKALAGGKSFEVSIELNKPSQSVVIIISSENIAGVAIQQTYKPKISPSEYPVPQTRPLTSTEMDIAGLEDDPDFWNMTLESDSPKQKSSQVPPKSENLTQEQSDSKTGRDFSEPKLRADGKYECNHSCKDKTACRHLCCREGCSEPPPQSKKKAPVQISKDVSLPELPKETKIKSLNLKSSGTSKMEKSMKELDGIHGRAQAVNDFQLPKGQQRLKLDAPPFSKPKRRMPVEFNMEFTDISHAALRPSTVDVADALEDDDLPESIIPSSSGPRSTRFDNKHTQRPDAGAMAQQLHAEKDSRAYGPPRKRLKQQNSSHTSPLFLSSGPSDSEGSIEISSPVPAKKQFDRSDSTMTPIVQTADQLDDVPLITRQQSDLTFRPTNLNSTPHISNIPANNDYSDEVAQALAELDEFFNSNSVQII
ncbi:hypothetical protein CPB83DRAFT_908025 [Crepidotus variabilis]|uniref:DNA 3'-5' helicase n=1 Tax=Crepidotus variabilis TaxID=179855 RepID=A0A9P6EDD4_9AGAR|nr:hypothetical protein CPB83DRAFT_908025 [Crepidotus variabilis]